VRYSQSEPLAERPFRAPLVPLVPMLGILMCLLLMFSPPCENWLRLGVRLVIGFAVYFGYSRRRSLLNPRNCATVTGVWPAALPTGGSDHVSSQAPAITIGCCATAT
jgi:amino acid transporter